MFEAAVILVLLLWAGIICAFVGLATGLFFVCFLLSITLFWIAFLIFKLEGLLAGAPVVIYAIAILATAVFIKFLTDPSSIRSYVNRIKGWIETRKNTPRRQY